MAFRTGYGVGLFSADQYGIDSKLVEGAASASISSAATAVAERVTTSAASSAISSAASAIGYTTIVGASTAALTSSTALYWNRVRPFSAQDSAQVGVSVNSRYKWINSPEPATSWTVADYLERAA